ncbi:hypothetical protein JTB14_021599 [Gonioctena quinquepunctata]|nr:hypothetical protein JTB14_021599 [Gonioctena quinquepunctata]
MCKCKESQKLMVPRTTLIDELHQTNPLKPGRPYVLTQKVTWTRLSFNIKRQQAVVGKPELKELFDIKDTLENTLPQNIYNCDWTNISNDPDAKKVFVPRETKRVERVQEHSRTSVNIMVCGIAKGILQAQFMRSRQVDGLI